MIQNSQLIDICDVAYAMSVVGSKWKIPAIWELRSRPLRLSELRRAMPGVSESVLIIKLKELCKDGIVYRTDYKQVPPKVTYELTDMGHELLKAIGNLEKGGSDHRAVRAKAVRL